MDRPDRGASRTQEGDRGNHAGAGPVHPADGVPAPAGRQHSRAAVRRRAEAVRARAGDVGTMLQRWGTGRVGHLMWTAAAALLGAWLALVVAGPTQAQIGPVEARVTLVPSWTGDTVISVPPLGSLTLDTHDGPLRLLATVRGVDSERARALVQDPAGLSGLEDRIAADARAALIRAVVRGALCIVLGAAAAVLVVTRRPRRSLLAAGTALVLLAGTGGAAAATWNPRAISTPQYNGLLTLAPSLIGNARDIVDNFDKYRTQLAKIVSNVSRLYAAGLSLPTFAPTGQDVRVLSVSDLHLNPEAFDVIRSVVQQLDIDVVVDSGDLTDHGSAPEEKYADLIRGVGVPYVFVRGNHDSLGTARAVAAQPNAVVLSDGETTVVDGIRFAGTGDPRFTPDKATRDRPVPPTLTAAGDQFAEQVRAAEAAGQRVDVAVVHDIAEGKALDGLVPLILSGHYHRRDVSRLPGGTISFQQGSTGGAGLRGLEGEKPTPVEMSVLYLDRKTGLLQAWDDITLGGLGLASAQFTRHVPEADVPKGTPPVATSPTPTGSPLPSPTVAPPTAVPAPPTVPVPSSPGLPEPLSTEPTGTPTVTPTLTPGALPTPARSP